MKKYMLGLVFLSLLLLNTINAQYFINPTRPSTSDNAFVTSYGYSEIEIGGLYQKDFLSVPTLVKMSPLYGVELGVSFAGLINYTSFGNENETEFGDVGFQIKTQYYSTEKFSTALLGRIEFPSEVDPKYTLYSTSSLITSLAQFDATVGVSFFDNSMEYDNSFIYAFAVSPKIDAPIGFFIELFGEANNGYTPISIDAGVAFSINADLVLDAAIAKGLNDDAADLVLQIGFTSKLFKIF